MKLRRELTTPLRAYCRKDIMGYDREDSRDY